MIDIAGLVVLVEEETEVDSPRNNLFVDVVDLNTFEQQPTTSQERSVSTSYLFMSTCFYYNNNGTNLVESLLITKNYCPITQTTLIFLALFISQQ